MFFLRPASEIRPVSTRNLRFSAAFSGSLPVLITSRIRAASALPSSRTLDCSAFVVSRSTCALPFIQVTHAFPPAASAAAPRVTTSGVDHRERDVSCSLSSTSRLRSSYSPRHFSRSNSTAVCSGDIAPDLYLLSIELMDAAENGLPRSFMNPRAASSAETSRSDLWPPLGRRRRN